MDCSKDSAKILLDRFNTLVKAVETEDHSHASFPLLGEEAMLELRSKRDTLMWVLEMLNISDEAMQEDSMKTALMGALSRGAVGVQILQECIQNIKARKKPECTEVTFLTDAITPNDFMNSEGKVGVILWVNREEFY